MCDRRRLCCVMATLVLFSIPMYLGVEMCLFLSDQYVFWSMVRQQDLPYLTKKRSSAYDNLTVEQKSKLVTAQKNAALVEASSNAIRITMGSITTPLIGYISDRFGRKFALIMLTVGELFHIGITTLIVLVKLNPWLVLLAGLCEGLTGGGLLSFFAQVAACLVDLAKRECLNKRDVNEKESGEDKARYQHKLWLWFTIFDGLASLCLAGASPISGALIYRLSFRVPMLISATLIVLSALSLFILPETLQKKAKVTEVLPNNLVGNHVVVNDDDDDDDGRTVLTEEPAESVCSNLATKFKKIKEIEPLLVVTMVVVFLGSMTALSDMQYLVTYLMGEPFKWNAERVGIYAGATHFASAMLSVIFTLIMIKIQKTRIKQRKSKLAMVALQEQIENPEADLENMRQEQDEKTSNMQAKILIGVLVFAFTMMAVNKIMSGMAHNFATSAANIIIYVAAFPRIFSSFSIPILRTLFSIWTHPSKQGFIQSVGALVCRIGFLISLTVLPLIYSATAKTVPGTVFYFCAGVLGCVVLCVLTLPILLRRRMKRERA